MSEPLSIVGAYGPCLLDCGRLDAPPHPLRIAVGAPDLDSSAYRLLRILDGAARCRLRAQDIACREGTVLLLPPGVQGSLEMAPRGRCIQASFDVVHQTRTGPHERRRLRHRDGQQQPGPRAVWGLELPLVLPEPVAGSAALLLVRLSSTYWRDSLSHHLANADLAAWLADLVARTAGRPPRQLVPHDHDPLAAAMDLASTALSHRIGVADLVQATGLGRSTCFARVRERTGSSPAAYLRERRLQRACDLLADPRHGIAQVGRIVGYRSAAAFSRAFHRRFGCTPRNWRQDRDAAGGTTLTPDTPASPRSSR